MKSTNSLMVLEYSKANVMNSVLPSNLRLYQGIQNRVMIVWHFVERNLKLKALTTIENNKENVKFLEVLYREHIEKLKFDH